jgi:hypothetical protein
MFPSHTRKFSMRLTSGAIMGLQDVRAGSTANTCKACRQSGTVRLQCSASNMHYLSGTATVSSDLIARRHTADRVQHARRQDQTCPRRLRHHLLRPLEPYYIGFCPSGTTCRVSGLIVTAQAWAIKGPGRHQYWGLFLDSRVLFDSWSPDKTIKKKLTFEQYNSHSLMNIEYYALVVRTT